MVFYLFLIPRAMYFVQKSYARQLKLICQPYVYYTGCLKKVVIEFWSALARSLYNLQKSFFHSRKDQAFSFGMSPFLWNVKKDWANTSQMKISGQNHIFPPLSIITASNKKRKSINHLSVTRNNYRR